MFYLIFRYNEYGKLSISKMLQVHLILEVKKATAVLVQPSKEILQKLQKS